MSSTTPLTDAINALTTYANEITGQSDTTLSDAVESLVDGYGGGSGDSLVELCNGTLTRLDDDSITTISTQLLRGDTHIQTVFLKNLIKFTGTYCLCSRSVQTIVLPNLEKVDGTYIFGDGTTNLTKIDIGTKVNNTIGGNFFRNASALTTIILRKTSIVPLGNLQGFNGTPFASGGTGGTIYIPKTLYNHLGDGTSLDYKAATNWSTIDGYGTITWMPIEGSIYETQYADGTPISTT